MKLLSSVDKRVYRFDFPAIDTYPSGDFSDTDSITQIASDTLALKEVVSEFAESANITGGLKVDTITTTGNVDISGSLNVETSLTTNQLIVNEDLYFDTIVIRRPTGYSDVSEYVIMMRELQLWINDVNVLPITTNDSINIAGDDLGDTIEFANFSTKKTKISQSTNVASNVANDVIGGTYDVLNEIIAIQPRLSDDILYIPLTSKYTINNIQSIVCYNRGDGFQNHLIGLAIELYNRDIDPDLTQILASTNEITTAEDVYRYDFPAIGTYPSGDFSDTDSITNIASETLALKEVVSEFAESANITGGLKVDTIMTTGNVDISGDLVVSGGIISAPNQVAFKATTTGILRAISNGAIPDFENVIFNIGGGYDNTNYKFTAPVAGKYYFVVRFYTTGNDKFTFDLFLNETTIISRVKRQLNASGGYTIFELTGFENLSVDDVVYATPTQETNISINFDNETSFLGFLIV